MQDRTPVEHNPPSESEPGVAAPAAGRAIAVKSKTPGRRAKRPLEDRRIPLDLASFDPLTQSKLLKHAKSAKQHEMTLPAAVRDITTRALNDAPPIDALRETVEALRAATAPIPANIQFFVDEWHKEREALNAHVGELTAALAESRAETATALANQKTLLDLSIRQQKDGFNEFGEAVGDAFRAYGERLNAIEAKNQQANAQVVEAINGALQVLAQAEAERAAPQFTDRQFEQIRADIHAMTADGIKRYLTAQAKAMQAGHANAGSPFNPPPHSRG